MKSVDVVAGPSCLLSVVSVKVMSRKLVLKCNDSTVAPGTRVKLEFAT